MDARRVRGLYAITPGFSDEAAVLTSCEQVLAAGARVLQYRDKGADETTAERRASLLARLCADHEALFIVNDDPVLAARVGADGVHLGGDDPSLRSARATLGDGPLVGASCYADLDRARAAMDAGADYLAFGAFHETANRPGAPRADLDLLARARGEFQAPIVCIGGIRADNAPALISAGTDAVAVIGGVFDAEDPSAAARELARLFE